MPFSNGADAMIWMERNCHQCPKQSPADVDYGSPDDWLCRAEFAISLGFVGDIDALRDADAATDDALNDVGIIKGKPTPWDCRRRLLDAQEGARDEKPI